MARREKTIDEKKFLISVSKRLVALRKRTHNNYENFAFDNNLTRSQYGNYETGQDFTMTTFFRLLKAYKISPEEFFNEGFEEQNFKP
jgi:transcriptional regulator with XRE-family HTH domain